MIFDDLDKKIRLLDSRVHWLEANTSSQHEAHQNYKEKLESLYDAFEALKQQIVKTKEKK